MTAHHFIRSVGRWLARHWRAGPCGKGTAASTNQRGNFDRFTERARTVMQLTQEEAQRLQHNYIGTEHLLLGLLREREGVAGKVLTSMGVDLAQARQAAEGIVGRGEYLVSGEIRLTHGRKKWWSLPSMKQRAPTITFSAPNTSSWDCCGRARA